MEDSEGRSPRPLRGDPNVKTVRVALTPGEWRELRAWAAEEDVSVGTVVAAIVRGELSGKPRRTFGQGP